MDLPHDWAVDLPFVDDRAVNGHGAKPLGRAYPETSVGWYRREFAIDPAQAGRRFALEFDGVFRDATVILNGHFVGRNLSGYAPVRYDVTDFLNYVIRGQNDVAGGTPPPVQPGRNVLIVRVDATEGEGWFYEGAGIYRHVWLESTAPIHVAPHGTFVTSEIVDGVATLTIRTEVVNDTDQAATVTVLSEIEDGDGKRAGGTTSAATAIAAWSRQTVVQRVLMSQPKLWSVDHPSMYRLQTAIRTAAGTIDHYDTPFGIRTIRFDADKGLFVNGEPVKIKGTCNHQDHAGVGAGLPDRLQDYRVARLKAMGSNAYRTSHNPPTPELLDACDRLGMLVLDETRMMSSNDEGLDELDRMVRRDRNHPSIFCWSIGNEEPTQGTDVGARIAETMKRRVRALDSTRLVTEAMNNSWGRGLSSVIDVQGFNYGNGKGMDDYHAAHPKQFTMGTETASTVSTRGIYANDPVKGYVSAYDINHPPWATTAEDWWTTYDARPWVAGGFVWTGFDYRGEPTTNSASQGWPCISSHFGIMDTCGFAKDLFYYYRAWWTNEPTLHPLSALELGRKRGPGDRGLGVLECGLGRALRQRHERRVAARDEGLARVVEGAVRARRDRGACDEGRRPADDHAARGRRSPSPRRFSWMPDRVTIDADGEDLSVIEVRIVDANGRVVPTADDEVTFTISGTGRLIGVGNGDPSSHEADRVAPGSTAPWTRTAFNGLCMAIVQATKDAGTVTVTATAPGPRQERGPLDGRVRDARAARSRAFSSSMARGGGLREAGRGNRPSIRTEFARWPSCLLARLPAPGIRAGSRAALPTVRAKVRRRSSAPP